MKHVPWIACCTLLTGLGAGPLAAQYISVQVNAHLVQWQDNTGLLGSHLQLSQPVTAIYTYDTNGPAIPDPMPPQYALSSTTTSIVVSTGGLTFQTGPSSSMGAVIQAGSPSEFESMVLRTLPFQTVLLLATSASTSSTRRVSGRLPRRCPPVPQIRRVSPGPPSLYRALKAPTLRSRHRSIPSNSCRQRSRYRRQPGASCPSNTSMPQFCCRSLAPR
jgi:hypothetical protein